MCRANVHASAIDCLAHYEISVGVGDNKYDPYANVTRRQMALFMQRSAMRTGVALNEEPVSQGLSDITTEQAAFQDAINQVVEAGILTGRGTTGKMFMPNEKVSRADMALIIIRLLEKASDQVRMNKASGNYEIYALGSDSPFTPDDRFDDARRQASAEQSNAIHALYELGITHGTSETAFSPELDVRRDQMASFITRALAFTEARPEGLTITPNESNTQFTVSVRNSDFEPKLNAKVDAFYVMGEASNAFKTDGTCNSNYVRSATTGACTIDDADSTADADGEATFSFTADADTEVTLWVWTGEVGDTVDDKTDLMDYTFTASSATGATATHYRITTDLSEGADYARVGNELTATVKIFEGAGASASAVSEKDWEFKIEVVTYKKAVKASTTGTNGENVLLYDQEVTAALDSERQGPQAVFHDSRTATVTTDSSGTATFKFGGTHDNITTTSINTTTDPKDTPVAVLFRVRSCKHKTRTTGGKIQCGGTDGLQSATAENLNNTSAIAPIDSITDTDPNNITVNGTDIDNSKRHGVLFSNETAMLNSIETSQTNMHTKLVGSTTTNTIMVTATDQYGVGVGNIPIKVKRKSPTGLPARNTTTNYTSKKAGMVTVNIGKPATSTGVTEVLDVWHDANGDGDVNPTDQNDTDPAEIATTVSVHWTAENTRPSVVSTSAKDLVAEDIANKTLIVIDNSGGDDFPSYVAYDSKDHFIATYDKNGDGKVSDGSGGSANPAPSEQLLPVTMDQFEQIIADELELQLAKSTPVYPKLYWATRNSQVPYNNLDTIVQWTVTYTRPSN